MGNLSKLVRRLIIPRKGYKFIGCDFSNIESRILGWVTQCNTMSDVYKKGEDLYKFMSHKVYKKPINEISKDERYVGKQLILGLGYQMGHLTFYDMNKNDSKMNLDISSSKEYVNLFRDTFNEIPEFWFNVEIASIKAVKHQGRKTKINNISFLYDGEFLMMELPSKRKLFYYKPMLIEETTYFIKDTFGVTHSSNTNYTDKGGYLVGDRNGREVKVLKSVVKKLSNKKDDRLYYMGSKVKSKDVFSKTALYGGKLTENIAQALSRDLMVQTNLRLYFSISIFLV